MKAGRVITASHMRFQQFLRTHRNFFSSAAELLHLSLSTKNKRLLQYSMAQQKYLLTVLMTVSDSLDEFSSSTAACLERSITAAAFALGMHIMHISDIA